jgi:hypothetical protein
MRGDGGNAIASARVLGICRAAWLVGISVREYREIEAGDRLPSLDTYERISELYRWPQTFEGMRP